MPLSDHEQRLLEQMERALYQEDPKFASSLRHGRGGDLDRRRVVLGSLGALAGLGLVVVGVATSIPLIGVLGFALMVAGAVWVWSSARSEPNSNAGDAAGHPSPKPRGPSAGGPAQSSDFMARMEQKWRKRREGGQPPF